MEGYSGGAAARRGVVSSSKERGSEPRVPGEKRPGEERGRPRRGVVRGDEKRRGEERGSEERWGKEYRGEGGFSGASTRPPLRGRGRAQVGFGSGTGIGAGAGSYARSSAQEHNHVRVIASVRSQTMGRVLRRGRRPYSPKTPTEGRTGLTRPPHPHWALLSPLVPPSQGCRHPVPTLVCPQGPPNRM